MKMPNDKWMTFFLQTSSYLSMREKMELVAEAVDMYYSKDRKRRVRGENYEGFMFTEGAYQTVLDVTGICFDAEIHTHKGTLNMKFLIIDEADKGLPYRNN